MDENRFASRKFILTTVAVLVPIFLVIFKVIEPNAYVELTKWVVGLYFTGNVVEKSTLVTGSKV